MYEILHGTLNEHQSTRWIQIYLIAERKREMEFWQRYRVVGVQAFEFQLSIMSILIFDFICNHFIIHTKNIDLDILESKTLFTQVFNNCSYHDFGICISLSIPRSIFICYSSKTIWYSLVGECCRCHTHRVVVGGDSCCCYFGCCRPFFHFYYLNSLVK